MGLMSGNRLWYYALIGSLVLVALVSLHHSHPSSLPSPSFPTSFPSFRSASSPSRSSHFFPIDPDGLLSFRKRLEESTSPESQKVHSDTLTFSSIYVLSLPERKDRRTQMEKLAKAHGLRIEFVDAVRKDEPFIRWIAEQAVATRKRKVALMGKTRRVRPESLGGLHIGNPWLSMTQDEDGRVPFPPLTDRSGVSWIDKLERAASSNKLHTLVPKNPSLNITEALHDPIEKIEGRQVNEGVISTFFGHTRAMKRIIEKGEESALILEDDVDVEWDLERIWSRIERKLPSDWDLSFLGHCWGRELMQPAYLHPLLHQSTSPLCLHAYALTQQGATKLLSYLLHPWVAYQTAVDTAAPSFVQAGLLNSFSIEPPLIIQRKDGPSDIQLGIGSIWRGLLMDSTVERIKRDEGEEVEEIKWDPKRLDPATVFRYGRRKCVGAGLDAAPPVV